MDRPPDYSDFVDAVRECALVTIELDVSTLMTIIAQCQLALRHPAQPPDAARTTREFIGFVREQLPPVLQTIIDMWQNPAFDVRRSSPAGEHPKEWR